MGRRLACLLTLCVVVPSFAYAASGDPKKRIAPADQKKAAAIVLKRTDLAAGWKRVHTPDSDLKCPGFNPDESDLTLTGESESEFETTQGRYVLSSSSVYVSAKDALASWTRNAKPALARCIAYFFRKEIARAGGKATVVRQGRISFPRFGPRTAAFRVAARATFTSGGKAVTTPFTIHVVAVGRGRGDTILLAMGPGLGVPSGALHEFAKVLASRLRASGF